MARYARLENAAVAEIVVLPEGVSADDAFHASIAQSLVVCDADIAVGWLYADGIFSAPDIAALPLDLVKTRLKSAVDAAACQCRVNFPQKRRSKIPQLCRRGWQGEVAIFGWPSARFWWREGGRCDEGLGADMFRHELGVLTQAVARPLDLHDDGVMQ